MALYINTNIAALRSARMLSLSSFGLDTSMQRLASGFRINSAADDAAGLQIGVRLSSQIQGLQQGMRNAQDGISVAQVAEGALQETTSILQRIRQLAVQSQNGINSSSDRTALQKEVSQLTTELNRISETSEFAGKKLLDGKFSADFLVGANAGQTIKVDLSKQAFDVEGLQLENLSISSTAGAAASLERLDKAIEQVGSSRADLGAVQNRFQSRIRSLSNSTENLSGARSRIMDTDFAKEAAELTRRQIMQQASIAIMAQAQQAPQLVLRLLGA
ncbi:flagellin N-terminal helical domain-containing protein [Aliidiomarina celeris]|uniref:flagellin N-terminal helical domain-containing protein n=1 Tax=Aliidiomarina celeris TaxID=2249428 RepID=UPI000DEBB1A0|nr:flagellin [Aliidiomarina celeris]